MANEETKTMITAAGLKKYEDELSELKVVRRAEVAAKIKVAREQGDLSENADYDAAKEEQTEIENRIVELEHIIRNSVVVADEEYDPKKINVGSTVKLLDMEYDEEVTYMIVGSSEADSRKGKISNESKVGAALIGHKKGDTVEITLEGGATAAYKVLKITKTK